MFVASIYIHSSAYRTDKFTKDHVAGFPTSCNCYLWSYGNKDGRINASVKQDLHWKNKFSNNQFHCVEKCPYSEFPSLYFPAFGLNTKRYRVSLRIQSKCGIMQTKETLNTDTFHAIFFFSFFNEV